MKTGFYELIQGIQKRGSDKSRMAHGELIGSLNTTAFLASDISALCDSLLLDPAQWRLGEQFAKSRKLILGGLNHPSRYRRRS